MARNMNVVLQERSSYALREQVKIGQYDLPFTLNPTIGCLFGCTYCFSPFVVYGYSPDRKEKFFQNVYVKLDKPEHLRKELPKLAALPQHMKRVQVNESSDYYLPHVLRRLKDEGKPDLMLGILDEFEDQWKNGNRWMLHILTKSHLILEHIEKLKSMRHMVQVEVSLATLDQSTIRKVEFFTPSVSKRLDLVRQLSGEGIFVRVMAMPFYGDRQDLIALKDEVFRRRAKSLKNKGLNYYKNWDDLSQPRTFDQYLVEKIPTGKGRVDEKDESLVIKGGEFVLENGHPKAIKLLFPKSDDCGDTMPGWSVVSRMAERFELQEMKVINCGYAECNDVDWGYII